MKLRDKILLASSEVKPRASDDIRDIVKTIRPNKIIEFGSWYGASALSFLQFSKAEGKSPNILCVDTWLGSIEHWENLLPNSEWKFDNLLIVDGEPRFIQVFKQVIKDSGFQNQVSILRCPTSFSKSSLVKDWHDAELAYIDGDHSSKAVQMDMAVIMSACSNAIISGDDYFYVPVRYSVAKFALCNRMLLLKSSNGNSFLLLRKTFHNYSQDFFQRGWVREKSLLVFFSSAIRGLFSQDALIRKDFCL